MIDENLFGTYISTIFRRTQAQFARALRPHGVGSGSAPFLMVLMRRDGICQEEVSRLLSIDKATTAKAVNRLVADGFLTRRVNALDRRKYCLYLTETGKALAPVIERIMSDWHEQLSRGLKPEERAQLLALLEKVQHQAIQEFAAEEGRHGSND